MPVPAEFFGRHVKRFLVGHDVLHVISAVQSKRAFCSRRRRVQQSCARQRYFAARAASARASDARVPAHMRKTAAGPRGLESRTPAASGTDALETEKDQKTRSFLRWSAHAAHLRSQCRKSVATVRIRAKTHLHP